MHFSLHPVLTISMKLSAPRSDQDGEQAEEDRGRRPRPREAHHPAVLLLLRHRSRCDIILGGHHRRDSPTEDTESPNAFSPVREYHDIYMTFCGITMTRFGAMTRNHDIASQTPPWGP